MSATEKKLQDLHGQLADALAERIRAGEASASDLSVARQFLKDNHIEAVRKPGTPLDGLAGAVSDELPPFDGDGDMVAH